MGVRNVEFPFVRWISPGIQFATILQRDPEVGGTACFEAFKSLRGYSDDGHGHAVDVERLAEDRGGPREAARPVVVTDHGERRVVCLVLFGESAAKGQVHSEAREECAAD